MVDDEGENRRRLDHPGNRPPQVAQKLEDRTGGLLRDFIGAEPFQPLPGLLIGEALRGGVELSQQFIGRCLLGGFRPNLVFVP